MSRSIQLNRRGLPSWNSHRFSPRLETLEQRLLLTVPASEVEANVPFIVLPVQDNAALSLASPTGKSVGKFTFGVAVPVSIDAKSVGQWEETATGVVSKSFAIQSEGALSLNLAFDHFQMPDGGELRISSSESTQENATQVYTSADNETHGELWSGIILGDKVVVKVTVPASRLDDFELSLSSVNHGFRDHRQVVAKSEKIGGDTTGDCNVDVICNAETLPGLGEYIDAYRDQIRSVGGYTLGGVDTCSGAVINNTANDGTPFFLTANHCGITSANAASMVVYWNFECSYCREPGSPASGSVADGSLDQFNTGAILRAEFASSDMTLVELDDPIAPAHNVHFAGWDRTGENATMATGIHHPGVAEKRISFEFDETSITSLGGYLSPGNGAFVRVGDWDAGTTEGGSSGSPLFDQNGRIIGQLYGGDAECGNDASDWYGRFARSWTGGGNSSSRLSDWLDPVGTGVFAIDGYDSSTSAGTIEFTNRTITTSDPVSILVTDADLSEPAIAVTVSTNRGDTESVVLASVGPGRYAGSIAATESNMASPGNSQLEFAAGDIVTATYLDAVHGNIGNDVLVAATGEVVPTVIEGVLWEDSNQNSQLDGGEPPLPNWLVYADLNNDRTRQSEEPSALSDVGGSYALSVPPGSHTIRAAEPQSGMQTFPVGRVEDLEPNDSLATAQTIDAEFWSLAPDPDINAATTRPHVSIAGTGDETFDYFQFTVANPNAFGEFDIANPTNTDTQLFLFNQAGDLLAENDDDFTDPNSTNSRIEYTFATPGTYIVGVGQYFSEASNGQIIGEPIYSGDYYTLHISLDGHELVTGVNQGGHDVTISAGETVRGIDFGIYQTTPELTSIARLTPAASLTNADTVAFDIAFSKAVASVTADDFMLDTSGSVVVTGSMTLGDGSDADPSTYVLTIDSISGDGTLGVDLSPTQDIVDLAGNPVPTVEPATDETYQLDNSAPTAVLSSTESDPTNLITFPVTIAFSEVVSGFELTDVTVSGGAGSNFTTSDNQTFTVDITPAADGTITVDVPGSVASDGAGNPNAASNQLSLVSDQTAPVLSSITRLTPSTGMTNADTVVFAVSFSEAVASVTADDFMLNVSGSVTANGNLTLGDGGDADNSTYTIAIHSIDGNGSLGIDLALATDIADLAGNPLSGDMPTLDETYEIGNAMVVGRYLFYNNSAFDTLSDDAAIATDKLPLFPGGTATIDNYSSYSRGINGIMLDIAGLPAGVALDSLTDFEFAIGNEDNPSVWAPVFTLPTSDVRRGAGENGSDRVVLTWPDGAIRGTWLEVRLKANDGLGFDSDDVFYFGNSPGESGNGNSDAQVDAIDFQGVRLNLSTFLNPAMIENRYDFNRDGHVNSSDLVIVRDHTMGLEGTLRLISPVAANMKIARALAIDGESDRFTAFAGDPLFQSLETSTRQMKWDSGEADATYDTDLYEHVVDQVLAEYGMHFDRRSEPAEAVDLNSIGTTISIAEDFELLSHVVD